MGVELRNHEAQHTPTLTQTCVRERMQQHKRVRKIHLCCQDMMRLKQKAYPASLDNCTALEKEKPRVFSPLEASGDAVAMQRRCSGDAVMIQ